MTNRAACECPQTLSTQAETLLVDNVDLVRYDCRGMRAKVPIAEGGLPIHVTVWGHHYGYDEDDNPIEASYGPNSYGPNLC